MLPRLVYWLCVIVYVLTCETWAAFKWVFANFILDKIVDFVPLLASIFTVRVALPTGIALGRRRRGHYFFEAIQYGTSKRFEAPQPLPASYLSSTRLLNMTPSSCFPQPLSALAIDTPLVKTIYRSLRDKAQGYSGTENAHQLNIWTPSDAFSASNSKENKQKKLYPVICWIHGGAFVYGNKDFAVSNGAAYARNRGVVFVSISYRLGILGFLRAPGVTSNCGTRDQLLALRWVKENIASFGGDPDSITLCAQSAGSFSGSGLIAIPGVAGNLVHRAMLFSGTLQLIQTRKEADCTFAEVAKQCGMEIRNCVDNSGETAIESSSTSSQQQQEQQQQQQQQQRKRVADHLRTLPVADLMRIQRHVATETQRDYVAFKNMKCGIMPFKPHLDDDVFPTNPVTMVENNKVSIPVLIGSTDTEYTFFTGMAGKSALKTINEDRLPMRIQHWCPLATEQDKDKVMNAYKTGKFKDRCGSRFALFHAINGDFLFRIPGERLATAITSNGGKAFVYNFADRGCIVPGMLAPHVADLHYWFDSLDQFPYFSGLPTAAKLNLRDAMMDGVSCFISGGDPWTAWKPDQRPVMFFDSAESGSAVVTHKDDQEVLAWKDLVEKTIQYRS